MISSFKVGRPVTGDDLVGREDVIKQVIQLLTRGTSVVLIAPRRYGKTSLVLEVLNRLKANHYFTAYVDVFASPTKRMLAENITSAVLRNKKLDEIFYSARHSVKEFFRSIELKQVIEDFEFILGFSQQDSDSYELLMDSLDFVQEFSEKNKRDIVIGFDEFGDLQKINGKAVVKAIRSKIQLQQNSAYIFSGSYESVMNELFVTTSSPFYRFAQIIHLGTLKFDDFHFYLTKKFSEIDIKIGEEHINTILEFSDCHPYYTLLVCQKLEILLEEDKVVTPSTVSTSIEMAFESEIGYIEKVWETMSSSRENVMILLCLAQEQAPYQVLNPKQLNIARSLKKLQNRGVVKKERDQYSFTDPFLKYWIRKNLLLLDKTSPV